MRTMKFRVWDEETSKMYAGNNVIVTFSGELEEVYVRRNNMVDELIDYKLMQSTGMKDTKVNEIYEGDLVVCRKDDIKKIGKVMYGLYDERLQLDLGFYIKWFNADGIRNDLGFWINRGIKVIGNIYENPELLG